MRLCLAVSVALEKDGRFLFIKRAGASTMTGMWEFPGGAVDLGESLEQAAKREVLEETGIVLESVEYVGYSERFDDRHNIVHLFKAVFPGGSVKLNGEEHSDFKWASKEEALGMNRLGSDPTEKERMEEDFAEYVSLDSVRFFKK